MQAQRLQHERANPRLAKAVARDEGKLGVGAAMAGRLCAEDQQTAAAALSHSRVLCRFCTLHHQILLAGRRAAQHATNMGPPAAPDPLATPHAGTIVQRTRWPS